MATTLLVASLTLTLDRLCLQPTAHTLKGFPYSCRRPTNTDVMWRPCCLSQVSNGGQKTKLLTCRYLDWLCVHPPARTDVMWRPCCLSQVSNGGQETKLLQCSQHCLQGEPHHICISYDSKSWQCSQNLHGPFLRAVLPTKVKAGAWADGKTKQRCNQNLCRPFSFVKHRTIIYIRLCSTIFHY